MTKSELVEQFCNKVGMTKKFGEDVVDIVFGEMEKALLEGKRIEIRGFGALSVREYGSYKGRNPKTGENVEVPPKKLPFFKVGKELREQVDASPVPASTVTEADED